MSETQSKSSNLVNISIKLPREMVEEIDRIARRWGLSRSEIIRQAILLYLRTARLNELLLVGVQ